MEFVDGNFDARLDSKGKDPDSSSHILRRMHASVWHKRLPDGRFLEMEFDPDGYLIARVDDLKIPVSSDNIMATFESWKRTKPLVERMPRSIFEQADAVDWRIGAEIIFPSRGLSGAGRRTINQARGTSRKIFDRFDLTLECIRRFYSGEESPLGDVLKCYDYFFELFGDFSGYTNFFSLARFCRFELSSEVYVRFF